MRAAVLHELGEPPRVEDVELAAPGDDQEEVEVLAAGLNPIDLTLASGKFYGGAPDVPYTVGREGVGRRADGSRAYFDGCVPPSGSVAERAIVTSDSLVAVPDDVAPALAVCFGIAGLAAWLALEQKARVREGDRVLILGASGVVGLIGVQAAKLLGASRVVAAARSLQGLERARELGADATVRLDQVDDLPGAFQDAAEGPIDVVLDPLWGEPVVAAILAAGPGGRIVQLGQSAGADATIPSGAIRGKQLQILGHSNFGVPAEDRQAAYAQMVAHAARGELTADFETVALDDAADAWRRQAEHPHAKLTVVP